MDGLAIAENAQKYSSNTTDSHETVDLIILRTFLWYVAIHIGCACIAVFFFFFFQFDRTDFNTCSFISVENSMLKAFKFDVLFRKLILAILLY